MRCIFTNRTIGCFSIGTNRTIGFNGDPSYHHSHEWSLFVSIGQPSHGEGYPLVPHRPPPFIGTWENPVGMGVKKKVKRQGTTTRKKQPIQLNSHSRYHFVIKQLSNFDLMKWVKKLGIERLRGIYSRDQLPKKIRKECEIINLDDIQGPGTHWVCYRNLDSVLGKPVVEYFDPFGLIMPNEALKYFNTASPSGKRIVYSMDEIQNRNTVLCGYWCLYYLFERQRGTSILDVIHNPHFDNDNSDFIKEYFS